MLFFLIFDIPKRAKLDSMLESLTTVDSRNWEARSGLEALMETT